MALVSIIIPFKNTAHYLPECINSIIAQTHTEWEVLAVNDSSTDNSLAVMEKYSVQDPRIKVYNNKGSGIIPALQTAYTYAQGDFITRMDSDDAMVPYRLAIMVQTLTQKGSGHVAVGQVQYFSDRGISNGYARYESWLNTLTAEGTNYQEIYKECVIPSPCWMVNKTDFDACKGFSPNRYPEDYDLTFRFYAAGLKIIPCDQVLHLWRDYDTRTSRTHEHYAQNYFLDIKVHYFLKLDYKPERPLVVWGAGFKGKTIAKKLSQQQLPFYWLCDNPNKIGKTIYGIRLQHFSVLENLTNPQSIITVANEASQKAIKAYLGKLGQSPGEHYFFFC